MCLGKAGEFLSLFRREIRHDKAVETDLRRFSDHPFQAVMEERIVVAHEYERCGLILRPQFTHEVERHRERGALIKCRLRRVLDGCAVGERIGKGDAKLHNVGAARQQRAYNVHSVGGSWETRRWQT